MKKYLPICVMLFLVVILVGAMLAFFLKDKEKKNSIRLDEPGIQITFDQEIDDGQTEMQLIVKAPETCVIGEMVTLDATASNCDTFEWLVIPATPDFRVITNGQEALFTSRAAGTYVFIIGGTREGILMPLKEVTVIVKPGIQPPPVIQDAFTTKVKSWLPTTTDPEMLEKLARSFERVASAGHKEVAELVRVTALSNRGILGTQLEEYKPFLVAFSKHLKTNYTEATVDKHIELWFNLANVLRSIK